ncbi:hypothetical protein GOV03_03065 [Candidatus Woesearchaeota archaeon]|nr:hypothetical protein [Candidatus Woesearchaeota archaeon]
MTEKKLYSTLSDRIHSDEESDTQHSPIHLVPEDLITKTEGAIGKTAEVDIEMDRPLQPSDYVAVGLTPPIEQDKKRFFSEDTRNHWGCLKDIIVGTYQTSKLPKPIAAVEGTVYAVVFDFMETIFRTYDKCVSIKDWFQDDPDKLENPFE